MLLKTLTALLQRGNAHGNKQLLGNGVRLVKQQLLINCRNFCWQWEKDIYLNPDKNILPLMKRVIIDLVFYNRLLRCYALIDLKVEKLTHQDIGQMQMYGVSFGTEHEIDVRAGSEVGIYYR